MKKLVAGIVILSLAGCANFGSSRLNPKNWFGSRTPKVSATAADPALTDTRPLVRSLSSVTVERASGGVILRATGTAPGAGYWGGELVPLAHEQPVNGALVYLFRVSPPTGAPLPRPPSLTAGHFIPDSKLVGVRGIVVRSQTGDRRASP